MGTHPIFESDFDCLTESKMKLFAFSCLASAALAKDIKQRMMENRLKFDRDVVITGDLEDDEEWDPWDLEDEELQARLRKLVARMDHNRDGFVDTEELTNWTLATLYNLAGKDGKEDFDLLMADSDEESAAWYDVVEDEYTHDSRAGEDADVFDSNDKSYRVRPRGNFGWGLFITTNNTIMHSSFKLKPGHWPPFTSLRGEILQGVS